MKRKLFEKIVMPIVLLSLSSCGVDTSGWPTINLGINPEDIVLYSARYTGYENDYNVYEYADGRIVTYRLESIISNMAMEQSIPYKEELMDLSKDKKRAYFLEITITTKDEDRAIRYIGHSRYVGAVCFENDEWHYVAWDFVDLLYAHFDY